jgi:hypothetical protein
MEASRCPHQQPDPRANGLVRLSTSPRTNASGLRRLDLMVNTVFERLAAVDGPADRGTGDAV